MGSGAVGLGGTARGIPDAHVRQVTGPSPPAAALIGTPAAAMTRSSTTPCPPPSGVYASPADKLAPCPDRLRAFADALAESGSPRMAEIVRRVAADVERS